MYLNKSLPHCSKFSSPGFHSVTLKSICIFLSPVKMGCGGSMDMWPGVANQMHRFKLRIRRSNTSNISINIWFPWKQWCSCHCSESFITMCPVTQKQWPLPQTQARLTSSSWTSKFSPWKTILYMGQLLFNVFPLCLNHPESLFFLFSPLKHCLPMKRDLEKEKERSVNIQMQCTVILLLAAWYQEHRKVSRELWAHGPAVPPAAEWPAHFRESSNALALFSEHCFEFLMSQFWEQGLVQIKATCMFKTNNKTPLTMSSYVWRQSQSLVISLRWLFQILGKVLEEPSMWNMSSCDWQRLGQSNYL